MLRFPIAVPLIVSLAFAAAPGNSFDIGDAVDAATDLAEEHGIDTEDIAGIASSVARNYSPEMIDDLKDLAARFGIDLNTAIKFLSTQRRLNPRSTQLIEESTREVAVGCRPLPSAYRVSCLQQGYEDLADVLPRRGDYADARSALQKASTDLNKIQKSNRDRSKKRVRKPGERTTYAATTAAALAQAERVIATARASLMRSAPPSDPRHRHFEQISAAVGASTILLRSA